MTLLDRILQNWRVDKAGRFIVPGMKVLDLGSADGVLFQRHGGCGPGSMGIDPALAADGRSPQGFLQRRGFFPQDMPKEAGRFDAVVMLAVLEHFPNDQHEVLADGIANCLRPGGLLIITVPSAVVDQILKVLTTLRLVHGMALEEHHGYEVGQTDQIFSPPRFRPLKREKFQLGVNNLFVFERAAEG
ncbi:MAG TPA: class I SAM-dependent methyltransferase [Candidatus Limnocylindria bacterium]|jgi:2-polyprenyl-3-methyl-5-hydroxy-6-metoxy-1,4-benzoquinol methylase|nr:class I SAM-dependent methyltransferase [Candidatus Limnocylindria bacterium]